MAEPDKYTPAEAFEKEKDLKTIEVEIFIPGWEVTKKIPVIGTAEPKKNCTVTEKDFQEGSVEIKAVVENADGSRNGYRYTLPKLPGRINTEECSIKFEKDGSIIAILKKAGPEPLSWETDIKKGLRNLR